MSQRCSGIIYRVCGIALLAGVAGIARADSLVIHNITYPDVRISGIQNGEIYYTFAGGDVHKRLTDVTRVSLNDEPALNAAETAFARHDWDKAIEGYEKTLRITSKAWLKEWVSLRLLESASQGGRFDSAVRGYIALAERSPLSAQSVKLKMPQPESAYLVDAIRDVEAAVGQSKQPAVRDVLLNLLAELHKSRGDTKRADDVLQRQADLRAAEAASSSAERQAARMKLKLIATALAQKQYDQAIAQVVKELPGFTDAADQAEALYDLAEAKAGKSAGNRDATVWKDVALAYMRVVIVAPPASDTAAQALLKTAAIHEIRLNEKATALQIYQQIVAEYPGQEAARLAGTEIRRIKKEVGG